MSPISDFELGLYTLGCLEIMVGRVLRYFWEVSLPVFSFLRVFPFGNGVF